MSFDPRSLERLKELGRQLPKPIETPQPKPAAKPLRQHRVETEDNPQELFRQLMQVSPDGTVPEHLMARMRELEADQKHQPQASGRTKSNKAKRPTKQSEEEDSLYDEFEQMLLEEGDD